MATTDIEIFLLFYSCTGFYTDSLVQCFLIFDDHTFISMRDTYFRCILSQLTESAVRPNRSWVISYGTLADVVSCADYAE